jgi:Anti-sigma factor NepR
VDGESSVMKSRKTNLEAVEPDMDKPELQDPMGKRPHKEIRLGRETQARIGELLRAMYNTYVNQGVPQHLEELVRRLGEQE